MMIMRMLYAFYPICTMYKATCFVICRPDFHVFFDLALIFHPMASASDGENISRNNTIYFTLSLQITFCHSSFHVDRGIMNLYYFS